MKIKVCGLNSLENIKALPLADIDLLGFIFYPKSSRRVTFIPDDKFMQTTSNHIRTGVFVNAPFSFINRNVDAYGLGAVQLHGDETPEACQDFQNQNLRVIKAFSVSQEFDFRVLKAYESKVDYFLFDTPTKHYGGSGRQFDWSVLNRYQGKTPFFLSGGIGTGDAPRLKAFRHDNFSGIDLNSRFETQPGLKDVAKLQAFLKTLKSNY